MAVAAERLYSHTTRRLLVSLPSAECVFAPVTVLSSNDSGFSSAVRKCCVRRIANCVPRSKKTRRLAKKKLVRKKRDNKRKMRVSCANTERTSSHAVRFVVFFFVPSNVLSNCFYTLRRRRGPESHKTSPIYACGSITASIRNEK